MLTQIRNIEMGRRWSSIKLAIRPLAYFLISVAFLFFNKVIPNWPWLNVHSITAFYNQDSLNNLLDLMTCV